MNLGVEGIQKPRTKTIYIYLKKQLSGIKYTVVFLYVACVLAERENVLIVPQGLVKCCSVWYKVIHRPEQMQVASTQSVPAEVIEKL